MTRSRRTQVTFQIPSADAGVAPMTFKGQYEAAKDELDCVAIFDGSSFKLERTDGHVKNLRHASVHTMMICCSHAAEAQIFLVFAGTYDSSRSRQGSENRHRPRTLLRSGQSRDHSSLSYLSRLQHRQRQVMMRSFRLRSVRRG